MRLSIGCLSFATVYETSRDVANQCIREFLRGGGTAQVPCPDGVVIQGAVYGFAQTLGQFVAADMSKHHCSGKNQRQRIRDTLSSNIRSGAVNRFEYCGVLSDVCAGRHSKSADETGDFVRENIAEEIGRDDHV